MPQSNLDSVRPLLDQLEAIESVVSQWQQGNTPTDNEIVAVRDEYLAWYTAAQRFVPSDKIEKFKNAYEGGLVIKRIRNFLGNPLEPNVLANPDDPTNLFNIYQYPFDDCFRESAAIQREILYEGAHVTAPIADKMEMLAELLSRVPDYLKMLADVGAPKVTNEKSLQDLLHPVLRVVFADVRREDFVPQFAGGGSRVDFLLKEVGIILETKMTRESLTDRKVGEELIIDWARYRKHQNCKAIFGLVYDPERRIINPDGLQADLTDLSASVPTCALIIH